MTLEAAVEDLTATIEQMARGSAPVTLQPGTAQRIAEVFRLLMAERKVLLQRGERDERRRAELLQEGEAARSALSAALRHRRPVPPPRNGPDGPGETP